MRYGGEVKVWDAWSGQEELLLKGHLGDVNSVCFSPDGKRIASGGIVGPDDYCTLRKKLSPRDNGQGVVFV